ncbi:helix-turn-helix domain-containing protein [Acuticoccus sp. MNP-M23]|uniref:helix-turn-helix domain-containing protein n=1 Tax=Acuticoccus sp. MNP-M23 TaxID=3072793 RepID=UPI002815151A|nr:helix-turn-helix domain-containing protein [Acuticoccus sp. MNP-M23]WMS42781.1 helix-turn-helix domain-containing protein [Acuticoccus sp. MNP-M23]
MDKALAMANALDGMSRAYAAVAANIERQALRDAVTRYNTESLAGLLDRFGPGGLALARVSWRFSPRRSSKVAIPTSTAYQAGHCRPSPPPSKSGSARG